MREAASQVLSERARDGERVAMPVAVSLGMHLAAVAVLMLGPGTWMSGAARDRERPVMTISLGGPGGPGEGGETPIGGRPIQEIVTLPEARRDQWVQPPAPPPPPDVVPVPDAPRPEPESDTVAAPEEARGSKPTTGPELIEGTAMADTGARGIGVGLSSGGLGGTGGELNVADFCCPDYLATMISLIERQWDRRQATTGSSVVRFTIQRDGSLTEIALDRSSGYVALDLSAQRAIAATRALPPLPGRFPEDSLTVRLTFEYQR